MCCSSVEPESTNYSPPRRSIPVQAIIASCRWPFSRPLRSSPPQCHPILHTVTCHNADHHPSDSSILSTSHQFQGQNSLPKRGRTPSPPWPRLHENMRSDLDWAQTHGQTEISSSGDSQDSTLACMGYAHMCRCVHQGNIPHVNIQIYTLF